MFGPVLPNTTLCSIVRDEMQNPAGDIKDFVFSAAPFVERAVILDTGSTDGTYEKLIELRYLINNLDVYKTEFKGYGKSRNESLDYAFTERVLVLDADERITREGFNHLREQLLEHSEIDAFHIEVKDILPNGKEKFSEGSLNPRLFRLNGSKFEGNVREIYTGNLKRVLRIGRNFPILHFLPSEEGIDLKKKEWYAEFRDHLPSSTVPAAGPASCPSFKLWKEINPIREAYR